MENVIVNGNFTVNTNSTNPTNGWIAHNTNIHIYEDTAIKYYISGGARDLYYDLPPGLYQKIDLSNYSYDVKLDIEYSMYYHKDIAAQRQVDIPSNLYIYEISSYDSSTNIPIVGDVRDSIVKRDTTIKYDSDLIERGLHIEETDSFSIELPPGYYVIGFGSNFIDINGDGFMADGSDLEGLCIEHIEAIALELTTGEIKLVHTSDCSYYGVESASFPRDTNFDCPEALEATDIGIRAAYNHTLEQAKASEEGYGAYFDIEEFEYAPEDESSLEIKFRLSFWYHSSLVGSEFLVYIYDIDTGYSYLEDTITIEANEWTQYTTEVGGWEGRYQLLIIPPQESYKSAYLMINKIRCSLQVYVEGSIGQGGKGTFEDPYNKFDGYVYYFRDVHIYVTQFDTDIKVPSGIYYVKIGGKYYMSYKGSTSYANRLCSNGFYTTQGVPITGSPDGISNLMYFFKDGSMAINESFAYGRDIYTADENGICRITSSIMDKLELKLDGFDQVINYTIDIPYNFNKTINATFTRQNPYVRLTVTSSDPDVATAVVSDINLEYDDNGYYNESNTIQVNAWHTGEATITVSCQSLDGSTISKSFDIIVRDLREYPENVSLEFLYDKNYITYGESLDLKYRLKPLISSNLPIDFQIVDPYNGFTLSDDGVITANDTMFLDYSCTVSAINYGSGEVATCTINLIPPVNDTHTPRKHMPVGINVSCDYEMEVGQVVEATASTYGEDNSSKYVTQNVAWSSSKPYVAMVDELGTITAITPGTTKITCTCLEDPYVKKTFNIDVVQGSGPALQRIDLNMTEVNLLIPPTPYGRSYEFLEYSFYPETTNQTNVEWTSSNPFLVDVLPSGQIRTKTNNASYNGTVVTITCKSANNPDISASCKVTLCDSSSYVPILYFQKDNLNVYVDDYFEVKYGKSNCSYITYVKNSMSVSIAREDGQSTATTVSFNDDTIMTTIKEEGTYIITATCSYVNSLIGPYSEPVRNTLKVRATKSNQTPTITKDLELLYALHDGTYIIRYYAENEVSENFTHYVGVDGTFTSAYADPLVYNGENYYYIFGNMKLPGEYEVSVRVVNGATYSATTEPITIVMPDKSEDGHKTSLDLAKRDYDIVTDDIINYLKNLITDKSISLNEHLEFETRYKLFNAHYENLKAMLDICIDHIDEEIKAEQAKMSTMATALTSDGTAVATYSMDEATNSNYKNVTDMDYYQNECIKALVQRVLELEARLNELTNNN